MYQVTKNMNFYNFISKILDVKIIQQNFSDSIVYKHAFEWCFLNLSCNSATRNYSQLKKFQGKLAFCILFYVLQVF